MACRGSSHAVKEKGTGHQDTGRPLPVACERGSTGRASPTSTRHPIFGGEDERFRTAPIASASIGRRISRAAPLLAAAISDSPPPLPLPFEPGPEPELEPKLKPEPEPLPLPLP